MLTYSNNSYNSNVSSIIKHNSCKERVPLLLSRIGQVIFCNGKPAVKNVGNLNINRCCS